MLNREAREGSEGSEENAKSSLLNQIYVGIALKNIVKGDIKRFVLSTQ